MGLGSGAWVVPVKAPGAQRVRSSAKTFEMLSLLSSDYSKGRPLKSVCPLKQADQREVSAGTERMPRYGWSLSA